MSTHVPFLICFCGPSASGKSTICNRLMESELPVMLSLSTTTRAPREGERDGVDYEFVIREEFEKKIKDNFFLEYAEYGGNLYGTGKSNITDARSRGVHLLLDIDVQGVEELRKQVPASVHVVFVSPPSIQVLEQRFRSRPGSDEESLKERMYIAKKELEILNSPGFSDFVLVNDNLELAVEQVVEHLNGFLN